VCHHTFSQALQLALALCNVTKRGPVFPNLQGFNRNISAMAMLLKSMHGRRTSCSTAPTLCTANAPKRLASRAMRCLRSLWSCSAAALASCWEKCQRAEQAFSHFTSLVPHLHDCIMLLLFTLCMCSLPIFRLACQALSLLSG